MEKNLANGHFNSMDTTPRRAALSTNHLPVRTGVSSSVSEVSARPSAVAVMVIRTEAPMALTDRARARGQADRPQDMP